LAKNKMKPLIERITINSDLKALLAKSWMLLLGSYWFMRFWSLKSETYWLYSIDVYKGDETVELVQVSLGRDGLLSLATALILLIPYCISVFNHFFKSKKSNPLINNEMPTKRF
jgi:hypothetical protein